MWYVDLLKMLYIADRECLEEEGDTITGDSMSALKRGPVLCTVLNLIKKKDSQWEQWHRFIGTHFDKNTERQEVFLKKKSAGDDELCRFEKDILHRIFEKHNGEDLIAYTHSLPEWKKHEEALSDPIKKNSYPITIEDILEGIGKPELVTVVDRNIAEQKLQSKWFGAVVK